jgi:hypothetical protein
MTEIPGSLKLLRTKTSIITNWATFYCDVNLQGDTQDNHESTLKPKLQSIGSIKAILPEICIY